MTENEMINKLIEHGEKLRIAQKKYYSHPGGGASQKIKNQLRKKARVAEAEFDNVIFNIKQLIK